MAGAMAPTSTSTTVDLSRLAPPTIVEQLDYETIFARKLAKVQELLPDFDATVDSDPAVKVLQAASYDEMLLRQQFNDRAQRVMVAFATGADLDHLAALVGVARLQITAANSSSGAPAVYEDDTALRLRIVLAPEGYSVAGPELAYVKHAKDASGDVLDASAISPARGEVLVTVLARTGDGTASAALLETVRSVVTDPAIRPLGDLVHVASAVIVPFRISAVLTTFSGPDVTLVLATARAALDAYLADNRRLGRSIRTAGVTAALQAAGVENVVLTGWAGDVICGPTQAAHCTGIQIVHGGYAS